MGVMLLLAVAVIAIDVLIPRKRLQTITAVYFGVIVGMFLTYVVRLALEPLLSNTQSFTVQWIQLLLGMVLCYTCVSVLLQTKDDFRFIIPYVEFAREVKGRKPYVLDTSVVIDGRIADVVETHALDNQLVMPRFAIQELQNIADSSDRMRRSRGRRGLDILNRLRANAEVELLIFDRELPEFAGQPVDLKLVLLAKPLKPVFLVGEAIEVRIIKPGEGPGQGIGYLDDGTMIVVEGGREHINETIKVSVTSMLQKSAGRMVFGRYDGPAAVAEAVK
jgi:uncharacterized protein YacL